MRVTAVLIFLHSSSCLHTFTFSAPLSAEPSSTQSEVIENGVDKSASDDSSDPSHNQVTGSESDLPEQAVGEGKRAPRLRKRTREMTQSAAAAAITAVTRECPVQRLHLHVPAVPQSWRQRASATAEISSDSSETADDTMEQDWSLAAHYWFLHSTVQNPKITYPASSADPL